MGNDNKLVKGAAILSIAMITVKAMGMLLRIPLTNWVGKEGMACYGPAYTVYGILLILSTGGVPIAISRLVSENIALGRYRNAHKVFRLSQGVMVAIGVATSLLCLFGAGALANLAGVPGSKLAIMATAPALLFVPIVSSFRGYFQGRQNMRPSALSEVTEQLFRVFVGLGLAWFFLSAGVQKAVAGATFGASVGAFAAMGLMFTIYLCSRRTFQAKIDNGDQMVEESTAIVKKIIVIAIPIVIGAELLPILNSIDMVIISRRLQETGWTKVAAEGQYGLLTGFCNPIIALPQVFTQAVEISMVPAIARGFAAKNRIAVQRDIALAYRTTMIMAVPCAIGIFALAGPILHLFYPSRPVDADAAASTLMIFALGVVTIAMFQTTTGALQAIGKQNLPVRNLLIGAVVKVALTYYLVGIPWMNIKGAAIGTMTAETIGFVLNHMAVKRYTKTQFNVGATVWKPLLAASVMGLGVVGVHWLLVGLLGNSLATMLAVLVGMVLYGVVILGSGAITVEELEGFPGGRRLAGLVRKRFKK